MLGMRKELDIWPQPGMRTRLSLHMIHGSVRQVTIHKMANCLQINHGSAHRVTRIRLGFHKMCARWAPKQFTVFHKQMHLYICQQHLYSKTESSLDPESKQWNGNIRNCTTRKSSKTNAYRFLGLTRRGAQQ
jgi:hypothetical protein